MVWLVVWIFLMMFWLFGAGFVHYGSPAAGTTVTFVPFGVQTLIPWLCVLIIGLVVFGAVSGPAAVVVR